MTVLTQAPQQGENGAQKHRNGQAGVAEASAQYLAQAASNATPASHDCPPGYKRTEVGVIPEDWEVVTIGEIADVKTGPFGSALHEKDYVLNGTPIITVEHLGELGITTQNLPMVSDSDRSRLKAYQLRQGDIVFSRVGSVDRNSLVSKKEDGWLFSGRLLRIRLKSNLNDSAYFSFHFHSTPFKRRVVEVAVGQTMPSLNTSILRNVSVLLPKSKKEQTAIANALSDVDALIREQEKLIAKKQAIKTATMQQLLTGRTRLPQFALREDGTEKGYKQSELGEIPEDWEVQCLGRFVAALDAGVSVNSLDESNAFPHDKHILKTSCVDVGRFIPAEKKSILPSDLRRAKCSPIKGAIIVSRMNTPALVGEIGYVSCDHPDLFLPDRLWQMRFKNDFSINSRWLSYLLSFPSVAKRIRDSATGTSGSMKNISKGSLMGLELSFPMFEEQTAIATILSDMDEEIQTLQQRLTKTRQIKQGMMQELLTGRTRLVKPGQAA
ncbi:restriction endonuclease subunit S [Sedimenticola thiotaurini]|uniref:restriction endonuclease subunit S n=1 Tax=Sedimenticola thiotaurini TaxID=1543721 RepID=UPI001F30B557|nr:restriction endonuclease subunit S [Sedimenticola thiotaurini]